MIRQKFRKKRTKERSISGQMRVLLLLLAFVFQIAGCGSLPMEMPDSGEAGIRTEKSVSGNGKASGKGYQEGETLEVHFIDVGQGDATLIKQGSHAMLIDGGNNDKGTAVQSYLQYQGVEELDYVIGTHPDSDHVGGLDVVMYKFPWNTVILPDLEKDTKTYQEVLQVIKDKGKKITYPQVGDTYTLGNAEFTVIAPAGEDYGDNWNDYSVGIILSFGDNRFVFTGDAEEDAEEDMLKEDIDLSADVLKAAHHGSDTANTMAFLKEVQPASVVISCGEGNSYGHPRAGAMNNFRSIGANVYRTDEQGTIVAVSDGQEITWNCSPSESWKAGEPTGGQSTEMEIQESDRGQEKEQYGGQSKGDVTDSGKEGDTQQGDYVINTNTGKFHKPSCSSVEQMKEENREYSSLSRQELIQEGYEPCGRCNP